MKKKLPKFKREDETSKAPDLKKHNNFDDRKLKTIPLPVLGSLARFVVEIRLGLATATCLAEAVGEPAPDGLAAMSLCKMTG